jgi:hypothetical protein
VGFREVAPADPDSTVHGTDGRLVDFWRWGYSDLVSNDVRGVFAEYLVGAALGVTGSTRISWAECDLTYRGRGIEVKATGDHQSWGDGTSRPRRTWGIQPARGWDPATNSYAAEARRTASVYVFAHWQGPDDAPLGPLDVATWAFHVVATPVLDERFPEAKTLSLGSVQRLVADCLAVTCGYDELRGAVARALADGSDV